MRNRTDSEHGIHYGAKSGVVFLDKSVRNAQAEIVGATQATPQPNSSEVANGIALWGTDNLLPQRLIGEIENTGVLSSGIQAKVRLMLGKGPVPMIVANVDKKGNEELEYANIPEVLEYLDRNESYEYAFAGGLDIMGVGETAVQHILTRDRKKIYQHARIDPSTYRVNEMQKNGASTKMFLSGDWTRYQSPKAGDPHYAILELLDSRRPYEDLVSRTSGFVFAQRLQHTLSNRAYYALPTWYSALKWVRIAQGIPAMKEAMFNNQMNVKYVVSIHEDYWTRIYTDWAKKTEQERTDIKSGFYDQMDKQLAGGANSFKSVYIPRWKCSRDSKEEIEGLKITAIDDKIGDGKLLPDSAAANSEILFALMLNPAALGVSMPGGSQVTAGSGSNIREAILAQVIMHEIERQIIAKPFKLVKRYNGWDPRIVIRYPSQLLTTTDTGANTKTTV